jgi:hypothetical protein
MFANTDMPRFSSTHVAQFGDLTAIPSHATKDLDECDCPLDALLQLGESATAEYLDCRKDVSTTYSK